MTRVLEGIQEVSGKDDSFIEVLEAGWCEKPPLSTFNKWLAWRKASATRPSASTRGAHNTTCRQEGELWRHVMSHLYGDSWRIQLVAQKEEAEGRMKPSRRTRAQKRTRESGPQEALPCKRCVQRDTVWKQCMTANLHGCSACKNVFDASSWNTEMLRNHRRFDRDLVCSACAERGFAPGKYDEHQCEECFEKFGSLMFDKQQLSRPPQGIRSRLRCHTCQTTIRCSKCQTAIEMKVWSKSARNRYFDGQRTMFVCKSCRAQGFHPDDLKTYKCQTCAGEFGGHKFHHKVLKVYQYKKTEKLQCIQCTAAEKRVLQCSKCKTAYELTYWSRSARQNHSSSQKTNLVCKACRAKGFHPGDLETYRCQTCAFKFGAHKFKSNQLYKFKYTQSQKLQCIQCAAAEKRVLRSRKCRHGS